MTEVRLLDHQVRPIRHLLDDCPKQKGMLVWHAMGTGKSATGLSFIASMPNYSCVLCVPQNLIDVWYSEGHKFGVDLKKLQTRKEKPLVITTYDTSMQNNFIDFLFKGNIDGNTVLVCDEAHNLIRLLRSAPPKTAAVLVSRLRKFRKLLLLTGTPMYDREADFRFLVNIAAGRAVVPMDEPEFESNYFKTSLWRSYIFGWTLSFFQKFLYQSRDVASAAITYDVVQSDKEAVTTKVYKKLVTFLTTFLFSTQLSALIAVSIPVFIPIILITLMRIANKSQDSRIRTLDGDKFARAVAPYVSFYAVPKPNEESDYPRITVHNVSVDYNPEQIDLWLRFASGRLTAKELVRINLNSSVSEAKLFGNITDLDVYKMKGRAIGNLHFDSLEAPKFLKIYEHVMRSGTAQQTVIYSSFDRAGLQLFARFCRRRGLIYRTLRPRFSETTKLQIIKAFTLKKINVLLLDPSYTEGISLFGARQMHILEPVENRSKLEQIVARVSRYKSHAHLPPQERNVDVYVWASTANNLSARIVKAFNEQKLWAKHQSYVGPWSAKSVFDTDLTPDGMLKTRNDIYDRNLRDLTIGLLKYQTSTHKRTCKVAFDPASTSLPPCRL